MFHILFHHIVFVLGEVTDVSQLPLASLVASLLCCIFFLGCVFLLNFLFDVFDVFSLGQRQIGHLAEKCHVRKSGIGNHRFCQIQLCGQLDVCNEGRSGRCPK